MNATPVTYVAHNLFTFYIAEAELPANQESDFKMHEN